MKRLTIKRKSKDCNDKSCKSCIGNTTLTMSVGRDKKPRISIRSSNGDDADMILSQYDLERIYDWIRHYDDWFVFVDE